MRHRKSGRHLSRTSSHRKAMFQNMAVSLFEHELIKTTLPKAEELRRVAEPLITLAKTDSMANRRLAFDRTRSKAIVGKLFNDLGKRYATREGGYLRILKCGFRAGFCLPKSCCRRRRLRSLPGFVWRVRIASRHWWLPR